MSWKEYFYFVYNSKFVVELGKLQTWLTKISLCVEQVKSNLLLKTTSYHMYASSLQTNLQTAELLAKKPKGKMEWLNINKYLYKNLRQYMIHLDICIYKYIKYKVHLSRCQKFTNEYKNIISRNINIHKLISQNYNLLLKFQTDPSWETWNTN